LPRLHSVQVFGRDGTTEATTAISVATYGYGSATTGGALEYQLATGAAGPAFVQPFTKSDPSAMPPSGVGFSTWATLLDITGDGLPDNLQFNGTSLTILRDWMHSSTRKSLSDRVLPNWPIEARTLQTPRYQASTNIDQLWRQAIDVNGDGRIDFIDA